MSQIISRDELPFDGYSWEFQGHLFGNTQVSFIIIEAQPGHGPRLHSHPYEEVFIVQAGQATYTVGDETIEASAGQIVIAPAHVPHRFGRSGRNVKQLLRLGFDDLVV